MKILTLIITIIASLGLYWFFPREQVTQFSVVENSQENSKTKVKKHDSGFIQPSGSLPTAPAIQEMTEPIEDTQETSKDVEAIATKNIQENVSVPTLAFSPYKVNITEQDSPLGRLAKNLQELKDLPPLEHFDKAPSLRFLTGKYVGLLKNQGRIGLLRFALYFKDNNLDELSDRSCAALFTPMETKVIEDMKSGNVDIRFLKGKSENQKSLVVNIKDQFILHVWQIDKREKTAWVKVYKVDKSNDLHELFYTQLVEDKEDFKDCKNI